MVGVSRPKKAEYKRSMNSILRGLVTKQNASALVKIAFGINKPLDFLRRYFFLKGGKYPSTFGIRTPIGRTYATVFCPDDIMTINEIFFRGDYGKGGREQVVVDFGSNIGISTIFFLTRHPKNFVYCFEPLPQNIQKLETNLADFEGRYHLSPKAVGEADGTVEFGWEPSGRYGGIGKKLDKKLKVECIDSNRALREIIERHGRIGLLKIDIESMEKEVTERIPRELAEKIDTIVIELKFDRNPHPATHEMSWRRPITTLQRKTS
jgi:FkbM family methyltransferase